jgi:hypothetical protein
VERIKTASEKRDERIVPSAFAERQAAEGKHLPDNRGKSKKWGVGEETPFELKRMLRR